MIKRYDFNFQDGKYILKYNNPNSSEKPFEINADDMQFDTKKFYIYMFSDVKDKIKIEIVNNIPAESEEAKKGKRVYAVIKDLCEGIESRLNEECFQDNQS